VHCDLHLVVPVKIVDTNTLFYRQCCIAMGEKWMHGHGNLASCGDAQINPSRDQHHDNDSEVPTAVRA
jgi:hypothetical protein